MVNREASGVPSCPGWEGTFKAVAQGLASHSPIAITVTTQEAGQDGLNSWISLAYTVNSNYFP